VSVGKQDGLVLSTPERGHREVPPLREEERREEDDDREARVSQHDAVHADPEDRPPVLLYERGHRVGLGLALGRPVVGAAVGGGGAAVGSCPDLNVLINVTMSLSWSLFPIRRTCWRLVIIA